MILAKTIVKRLEAVNGSLGYDFDVRYLDKWIRLYPQCFPKFILSGNFETRFVWKNSDFRYELHKL